MASEEKNDQDEQTVPGGATAVEEIGQTEVPASAGPREGEVAITPRNESDMAYRLGRFETELVEIRRRQDAIVDQLAAFEAATIAAVEAEAEVLSQQGEVVAELAEEVLPDDNVAARANNPDHGSKTPKWWEQLCAGCSK